jgi:predicted small secreted protein
MSRAVLATLFVILSSFALAGCEPTGSTVRGDGGSLDQPIWPDVAWLRDGLPDSRPRDLEVGDAAKARDLPVDQRMPVDQQARDKTIAQPDVVAQCSAQGVSSLCDPVTNTGCASGSCYVVPPGRTVCVCPVGTQPRGAFCNQTVQCQPHHGCKGDAPPGICRRFCKVSTSSPCLTSERCQVLTAYPSLGFCVPK